MTGRVNSPQDSDKTSPGGRPSGDVRAVGRPAGTTSEETKRQILDAARQSFAQNGYAGASNKDIAERAGLTAASISYHFGTKHDLFLAVHQDIQDDAFSRCQTAARSETTMRHAIIAIVDTLGKFQSRPADILRFNAIARIEAARHPEIASARDDSHWRSLFAEVTQLGISTGEIPAEDEHAVRALMATLITGLAHHAAEAPPGTHLEALRALKLVVSGDLIGVAAAPRDVAAGEPTQV